MATTSATLSSIFPTTFTNTMLRNPSFNNLPTYKSSLLLGFSPLSVKKIRSTRLKADSTDGSIPKTLETAQEIMEARGDGVSTIISSLLFAAFVGLSILSIGVVYIAVTDFLQKREKDKFEKEEASRAKIDELERAEAAKKKNKRKSTKKRR